MIVIGEAPLALNEHPARGLTPDEAAAELKIETCPDYEAQPCRSQSQQEAKALTFRTVPQSSGCVSPTGGPFLQSISRRAEGHEIGDGIVARAVGRAFKAFYRSPADDTGLRAPKLLRKVGDGRAI